MKLCGGCGREGSEELDSEPMVLTVKDVETTEVLDLCVDCIGASDGLEVL